LELESLAPIWETPEATKRYFEFLTVPIRNKNTRIATIMPSASSWSGASARAFASCVMCFTMLLAIRRRVMGEFLPCHSILRFWDG